MKRFHSSTCSVLIAVLFIISLAAGCARKPHADETASDYAKYRKALYSAEVVYGVDLLGDVLEIFKGAGVLTTPSARAGVEYTDQGLVVIDEFTDAIEKGLPLGKFDKARDVIARVKNAIANGAIKFNSEKAQTYYFSILSTVEVSINLLEAYSANKQSDVDKLLKSRTAKARALQERVAEPWWNTVIVRGTQLATDIATISPLDAAQIWPKVRDKSKATHAENKVRLATWQ